jgi:hypothetical protein
LIIDLGLLYMITKSKSLEINKEWMQCLRISLV